MKAQYESDYVEVRPFSGGRIRFPYRLYKGGKFVRSYRTMAEAEAAASKLRTVQP